MDSLQEILFTLRKNKLRTALTAFGVFWGILMLILLLGAGRGMQNGVMNSFGNEALDSIIVFGGTTAVAWQGMAPGRRISFREGDLASIEQQIKGIDYISGENSFGAGTLVYGEKTGSFDVLGIDDRYFNVRDKVPYTHGRKMNALDEADNRKVVVIGKAIVDRLFEPGVDPVGEQIRVNDITVRVVGVYFDKGNNGRNSERLFMPYSTFKKIFGGGDRVNVIWIKPEANVDGFALEKETVSLLKRRHQVAEEDRRAINSFNMAEPAKMLTGMFFGINAFIWFVGLGTLMAGIVGISNIMIITVKERTREIGIRKALGATPFTIVSTLLIESVLVTAIAGYTGLVLGIGLIELVSWALQATGAQLDFFDKPEVDFATAVTAVILLVVIGALAGLVPAIKAARIMPIEAMRAE
jgi:putative ABC transport system permease protein